MNTKHTACVNLKHKTTNVPSRWRVPHENASNQIQFSPTRPLPNTQSEILNRRAETARRAVINCAKQTQFPRFLGHERRSAAKTNPIEANSGPLDGTPGGGVHIGAKQTQFCPFLASQHGLGRKAKPIKANFPGPGRPALPREGERDRNVPRTCRFCQP